MSIKTISALFLLFVATQVSGKVYDRCELALALRDIYGIPTSQIPTWVCIAYRESNYDTAAYNPSSGDHGIFQISELYWCSPPGTGCGVSCAALEDDDIRDDVACAMVVYGEMGFSAWVTYNNYCKFEDVNSYVAGCY